MPEADVFRFICPMHIAPVIDRWLRLEDKDVLIKRVMFGGVTFVIWQDIFGRWMPFTAEQKKKIKEWKKVYKDNIDVFLGLKPIPYAPTFIDDLYCNIFKNDDDTKTIYTFYNDNDSDININKFKLNKEFSSIDKLIGNGSILSLDKDKLSLIIKTKEVMVLLLK